MRQHTTLSAVLLLSWLPGQGRGDYFNVETPLVKPVAIATLAGHDYLLVCNTPDNAVEVWDTHETAPGMPSFLTRIPVGLEPCSIAWNPDFPLFYTADFLSDSVTAVALSAPSGPGSLTWSLAARRGVGTSATSIPAATDTTRVDEPMDIAVLPGGLTIAVTSHTGSTVHFLDAGSLEPQAVAGDTEFVLALGNQGVKEPRRIAVAGGNLVVLAFKGGSLGAGTIPHAHAHDVDLLSLDLSGPMIVPQIIGRMATTNAGLAVASNGDLYLTGGLAQVALADGAAVAAELTGFVRSMAYVRRSGATQTQERNLNLVPNSNPAAAVTHANALASPTDIVAYEREGQPTKLFVAAMGSDRIGVLTDTGNDLAAWPLARIDITTPTPTGLHGPRGLALKRATGQDIDPGNRLYVLNRVSHTLSVIDPDTNALLATQPLNQDPTPPHIRAGRQFLYDARLSLNGFVSCASCHPDGRTDGLAWNLGAPGAYSDTFARAFVDSPSGLISQSDLLSLVDGGFRTAKGRLVTQSLQGLVNFETAGDVRARVTNAPYHWRGDRKDFLSFNEAFVGLMGRPDQNPNNTTGGIYPPPADRPNLPMGISNDDMLAFEAFAESIHYPPNPQQRLNRRYSGKLGTANSLDDGTLALSGLKQFHLLKIPGLGNRACVHCHQLPEGSNNLFTFSEGVERPLESAALRGLLQKERTLETSDGLFGSIVLTNFGVLAGGDHNSINSFENRFNPTGEDPKQSDQDRKRFVHEFDWGVAPMVGQVETVGSSPSAMQSTRISAMEQQAREANAGLVVHAVTAAIPVRGFRFEPNQNLYLPEPAGGAALTRSAVLALLTSSSDLAVFQATPLGSERRVADPSGQPGAFGLQAITGAALLGMVTNTANQPVPMISANWIPVAYGGDFDFQHPYAPTPPSLKMMRQLQWAQTQYANGQFGLVALRHDASRRFRIAAAGLLPGCRLLLGVDPTAAPTTNSPASLASRSLDVPLYPTSATAGGLPVWESAVELDAFQYLMLMAGGVHAPGVADVVSGLLIDERPTAAGVFDPIGWNLQHVSLQNPGSSAAAFGWHPLTIQ